METTILENRELDWVLCGSIKSLGSLSRSKFPRKWVNGMRNPFSPRSGLGYSWFWVRDMMSQQQGLTHFVQVLTHLTDSLRQWCM